MPLWTWASPVVSPLQIPYECCISPGLISSSLRVISLHTIRHTRLWLSLSIHFGLLLSLWQSSMIATQLLVFVLNHSPPCFFFFVYLVSSSPPASTPMPFNAVLLSVRPYYMSDPIPSSAPCLITCPVHSCGLLDLLLWDGLGPPILSMRFTHLYFKWEFKMGFPNGSCYHTGLFPSLMRASTVYYYIIAFFFLLAGGCSKSQEYVFFSWRKIIR